MTSSLTEFRGPSWIHGGKQNPFFKLAEQTDSALYDPGDLKSIFDCNGRYLDKESADQQTNEVWSILEEGFEFSEKHSKDIPAGQSLADYVQQVVQDRVNSGTYTPEVGRNILDHMRMWGAMIGTEIERQSFKFFWLERVIDGGKHHSQFHVNSIHILRLIIMTQRVHS